MRSDIYINCVTRNADGGTRENKSSRNQIKIISKHFNIFRGEGSKILR